MPEDPIKPLLTASDLCYSSANKTIIKNVSLTLNPSEIVTLIGPNGAGKTTLIRLLLDIIKPDSGNIHRQRKLTVGYMPQKIHLNQSLPLNVERFMKLSGGTKQTISWAIELCGIAHLTGHSMHTLSGGELQRILLARALAIKPQLLILDEPVQGVDIAGQIELYGLIKRISDTLQCGVLMISHDLHLVMEATDSVICLNQHVCCHGHPESVSNHPAYLELFGQESPAGIAVYTHHHDHEHDIHGDIVLTGEHRA